METDLTWREKRAEREIGREVDSADRFVDAGVTLRTVIRDDRGTVLIDGCPPMRIVNVQPFGGIIDTAADKPYLCGPSEEPVGWFCSAEQEPIILHGDAAALGSFVHGSEGAGKTSALAMWHWFRWMEHLGERRMGGQFAPTLKRLGLVQKEMEKLYRPTWGKYVLRRNFEGFEMCDGASIFFQSTHKGSAAGGSQVQGSNLSWTGEDEKQDMVSKHADIMSRGRSAKNGRCKRLGTTTNKDDSAFRDLRDALITSGQWKRHTLSIFRSPFIDPSFLETVKPTISKREFLRRYGDPITHELPDLPPELAVYYGWIRTRNLTHRPRICTDVTAAMLAGYRSYCRPGAGFSLLCSHDPGAIYNTTEIVRLLVYPYERRDLTSGRMVTDLVPTWAVVGELQTEQTSAREHALELKKKLQQEFGVDWDATRQNPQPSGGKACIFVDPHGKGEADTDYQTVYMAFQQAGLDVFNPAPMSGKIRRAPRIEMLNRLLGDTDDMRPRLVVLQDERGLPCAPKLIEALETLRKEPGAKNPEGNQVKDANDKTHAPAALAYGLWPFEQEAFTADTVKRAIAEARRMS